MRSLFFKLITVVLFAFGSKDTFAQSEDTSGVKIRFYNKTNFHLDSLSINNKYIGKLFSDSSTEYLVYESVITTDGVLSLPWVCAKIGDTYDDLFFNRKSMGYCGVGLGELKTGAFEFDIKILYDVGKFRLYLAGHKEN